MIHRMYGPANQNSTSLSFEALERSSGGGISESTGSMSRNKGSVNHMGAKRSAPENKQLMQRDSKVSKHLSTRSTVDSASSMGQSTEILEKRRPSGRSNK